MARVSTYLNFMGQAEEALGFYASVFGTELAALERFADMPADPSAPPLSAVEQQLILHAELPILAGHVLMATDMLESMGHAVRIGNNVTINLEPDSRAEADRLFSALSKGSSEAMGMMEMFWGAYWGTCLDRYGIRWMVNAAS
ncbi:MAG: 3-demethylubiquinone-9 3-methyltransferase [Acidimicrobiaceae bacterium]|jgi:PhnB protein|nr:3-demethylubiquinone-9 3-methyltransferase [Acidimicrobiaceae bacterium]